MCHHFCRQNWKNIFDIVTFLFYNVTCLSFKGAVRQVSSKLMLYFAYLFLHKLWQNMVWMKEYNCNNQNCKNQYKWFDCNLWRKLKYKLKIPVISKQDLEKKLTETSYSKYLHLLERFSFAPWRNGKEYNGLQNIHHNPVFFAVLLIGIRNLSPIILLNKLPFDCLKASKRSNIILRCINISESTYNALNVLWFQLFQDLGFS